VNDSTINAVSTPEDRAQDPLTDLLRSGARDLIKQAVEAELATMLSEYKDHKLPDGRQTVVRNGYLPERTVQTGIGDVEVKVPKVRDRSGSGIKFSSTLLPPYLKRSRNIEELIPWLYLKGLSTGDYSDAMQSLLGKNAKGLSANTISRLKSQWLDEHYQWRHQDLSQKRYVYFWADGIYSNVRMDDRLCLLVIIGVTEHGKKELVAVEDGYRESSDSWVHKTANVLSKLPKAVQPKIKAALHDIWMAETRSDAYKAFDNALERFGAKYTKAMDCLKKDKEELLAFYDFPAEHWLHIRTTNPIESAFATVRLRTKKSKNCGSRDTTLAMVYKLMQSAEKRWIKIRGFRLLTLVVNNVEFKDGIKVSGLSNRKAA
jgi:transposase-like protein